MICDDTHKHIVGFSINYNIVSTYIIILTGTVWEKIIDKIRY